jgi:predicted peptidase
MIETAKTFKKIPYLEFVPPVIDGIMLYHHGMGERGWNLDLLKSNPIPEQYKKGLFKNYLTICPQMPGAPKTMWSTTEHNIMLDLVTQYRLQYGINKAFLTGLSLGGFHSLAMLKVAYARTGMNTFFNAVGIMCGKTSLTVDNIPAFTATPIKWWHGVSDPINPIGSYEKKTGARGFKVKVNAAGGNVELVEWATGHNVWDRGYTDAEFWSFVSKY